MKTAFFLSLFIISFSLTAQHSQQGYNRLGVEGLYAISDLNTSNFQTKTNSGFLVGFSNRVAFYNDFDMIYGIDYVQTSVSLLSNTQEVAYTLSGLQVKLLLSYLILGDNLSVEAGPALQVNGKLKLDNQDQSSSFLDGYTTLQAVDVQEISRVNGIFMAGITGGFTHVRAILRYQYNFTNILNGLNKEDLQLKDPAATNFKGNLGLITAGIVLYL